MKNQIFPALINHRLHDIFKPIKGLQDQQIAIYNQRILIAIWVISALSLPYIYFNSQTSEGFSHIAFYYFCILMSGLSIATLMSFWLKKSKQPIPHYLVAIAIVSYFFLISQNSPPVLFRDITILTTFAFIPLFGLFALFPKSLGLLSVLFWSAIMLICNQYSQLNPNAETPWLVLNLITLLAIAFGVIIRKILIDWSRALYVKNKRIRELTEANALLDITLNSNQFGLVGFNYEGRLAFERGASWRDLFFQKCPTGEYAHIKNLSKLFSKNKIQNWSDLLDNFEEIIINDKHFLLRAYQLEDMIVITHMEITEIRNVEAEIRNKQKYALIGEITAGVAHNYNNSLSTALSRLETFPENQAPKLYKKIIEPSIEAIEQSANISKKLLTLSGCQNLACEIFDVAKLLKEIKPLISSAIGSDIKFELNTDPNLWIETDSGEFQSSILNLVVNAKNAMPCKNGALAISARNFDQYVIIRIEDNGHGIPESIQNKVFDPFFSTKQASVSSGLGLSTVKGFVEQSNGLVKLQSSPNGTTVELYFPCAKAQAQPLKQRMQNPSQPRPFIPVGAVLLVDDNLTVLNSIQALIEHIGFECVALSNAQEALYAIQNYPTRFTHAFLDYSMPEMNGIDLGVSLQTIQPDISLYLLTGETTQERNHRAKASGFTEVLIKPAPLKTFLEILSPPEEEKHKSYGNHIQLVS